MRRRPDRIRTVILGAAGRDFHNFNVAFRDDGRYDVVAFTAAQIEGIADRRYPASLAGHLYPDGIAIIPEDRLESLCREMGVAQVVFAYSDVTHEHVMHLASRALACGADFTLLGPDRTMLRAGVPVIAVSAVRTGCGKSQTSRWLSRRLGEIGVRVAVIRHPMPYGDLSSQAVQRFRTRDDLDTARCTVEEREEFEPHLAAGHEVFAGIDYARVLAQASQACDVVLWDGGNNDFPFVRPDIHVVLADALRPSQVATHHPGEAVLRMADVVVIGKTNEATREELRCAIDGVRRVRPDVPTVLAASPVRLDDPELVRGRRVLVIEDGPTTTHGGMPHGAGLVAARAAGAATVVDPRQFAVGSIAAAFRRYPHLGPVLPALGYAPAQIEDLRRSVENADAEVVVSATPIDLEALLRPGKPVVRARYEYEEASRPGLWEFVRERLEALGAAGG